jgi:hypothetical protein
MKKWQKFATKKKKNLHIQVLTTLAYSSAIGAMKNVWSNFPT